MDFPRKDLENIHRVTYWRNLTKDLFFSWKSFTCVLSFLVYWHLKVEKQHYNYKLSNVLGDAAGLMPTSFAHSCATNPQWFTTRSHITLSHWIDCVSTCMPNTAGIQLCALEKCVFASRMPIYYICSQIELCRLREQSATHVPNLIACTVLLHNKLILYLLLFSFWKTEKRLVGNEFNYT